MSLATKFFLPLFGIIFIVAVTLWTLKPHDHPSALVMKVGHTVPQFDLLSLTGEKTSLHSVSKKVTLLNFWATWCPPCLNEIPSLVRLQEKYLDKGVQIVFINVEQDAPSIAPPVLKDLGFEKTSYHDPDQKIADLFNVTGLPLTVILDSNQKILLIEAGDRQWDHPDVFEQFDLWLK
jgi:thiol-disulfide isomerase/thioredoxin